jgi:hypothetical protein
MRFNSAFKGLRGRLCVTIDQLLFSEALYILRANLIIFTPPYRAELASSTIASCNYTGDMRLNDLRTSFLIMFRSAIRHEHIYGSQNYKLFITWKSQKLEANKYCWIYINKLWKWLHSISANTRRCKAIYFVLIILYMGFRIENSEENFIECLHCLLFHQTSNVCPAH